MNNTCPTCGALYNVSSTDVGRKIKCKKCNSPLAVTEEGLELDGAVPASNPKPKKGADMADEEYEDDEPVVKKGKSNKFARVSGSGGLAAIGGLPTLLFGLGVFMVILFTFMEKIGEAAIDRAKAGVLKLQYERDSKIRKLLPKGKFDRSQLSDDEKKNYDTEKERIEKDYAPQLIEAADDSRITGINNVRSVWLERYGLMFGFMFVAFGSIGFLRSEQPLVLRIVAAVILSFMMIVVFSAFGGCGGKSPSTSLPKGAMGFPD